ncbi:MAG: lamin tail domain-containing protein [Verrucomicrobiae bacterium]|nr:lamin tail domain-containing protein [Verrucomicrobiae bacterium]
MAVACSLLRRFQFALLLLMLAHRPQAGDATVVFNELQYQPRSGGDSVEWVELHNLMAVDMDLSGWGLTSGIRYTFPSGTILPGGGYLVVAGDPAALPAAAGATHVLGPFEGRLANEGERLELRNQNGRLMDEVRYGIEGRWPVAPTGSGVTLAKRVPGLGSPEPESWSHSRQIGGTPGAANFPSVVPALPGIRFNELGSPRARPFWIELANDSDQTATLAGLIVRHSRPPTLDRVLPAGEGVHPGGFRVLDQEILGTVPEAGDRLFLFAADGTNLLDAVRVGPGPWAREVMEDRWQIPTQSTPGATNTFHFHRDVVINEIQYHPRPIPGRPAVVEERLLLEVDASWRFDQSGADLGTAWRRPDYPDDDWASGRGVLYAEAAELPAPKNTPLTLGRITYYFRTAFTFDRNTNGCQLALRLLVDDGAVIHLNGTEILRLNMPDGPIAFDTLANVGVGDAAFSGWTPVDLSALRTGTNVLAVEVHQNSAGSSDIVFGLEARLTEQIHPAIPAGESPEAWVELFNQGSTAVQLGGWQLTDGIRFAFPEGTSIAAGEYLVVAADAAELRNRYPNLRILGNFSGRLSRSSDRLTLLDAVGNVAGEVRYFDRRPWPAAADGGGSTLELRDPRSDPRRAESWAASDESARTTWVDYAYSGVARADRGPTRWNEFIVGLLDTGEVWLDDLRVTESPDTAGAHELLQNGDFENGSAAWRFLGNHRRSEVIPDPDRPGNHILRLVASGPTEHMHNHLETTLVNNTPIVNGRTYRISFRARSISGSPRLNSRLYFNRLARTTLLETPARSGTPGARNSRWTPNAGPAFDQFQHQPAVPAPSESTTVSARVSDPDGVTECTLWWNPAGQGWRSSGMSRTTGDRFEGTIPPQATATVVQFYIEATDRQGARSHHPAAGPDSRALYQVRDGQGANTRLHQLRIIMTAADSAFQFARTNLMSNEALGGTVVVDESEVFHDVGVRLQASQRGRPEESRVGFTVQFAADRLFRGTHNSVTLDRSGGYSGRGGRQDEIVLHHIINQAGGMAEMYNDLVRGIFPRPLEGRRNGIAQLATSKYGGTFLEDSVPRGGDGGLFKIELIYFPTTTAGNDPQRPKLPQPDDVISSDIEDRGDDPEAYRWHFLIENRRDDDDYAPVVRLAKAMSLSGAALDQQTRQWMDVDQWARVMALKTLSGDLDTYGLGYPHNQMIYFRPGDGRAMTFTWDMDYCWARNPSDPLPVGANIGRVLALPGNQRRFLGHVGDLLERSFNATYMSRWTAHYGLLAGQNYSGVLSFIQQRAASARNQLPRPVPLSISTGGGADLLVNTSAITLAGRAGIEYKELVLRAPESGEVWTWTSFTNWQVRVPLWLGENPLEVLGYNFRGELAASNRITVTSTVATGGRDADLDGMPDAWERSRGLDPDADDAALDPDGDGFSNRDEYLAGTHPLEAGSRLQVRAEARSDSRVLRFRAEAGRSYTIRRQEPLGSRAWEPVHVIPAGTFAREVQWEATVPGEDAGRFYQVATP